MSLLISFRRCESGPGFGIPFSLPLPLPLPCPSGSVGAAELDPTLGGVGVPALDGAVLDEALDDSPLASLHLLPPYARKGLKNSRCFSLCRMKLLSDFAPLTRNAQSGKPRPPVPPDPVPASDPKPIPSNPRLSPWYSPLPSSYRLCSF